VAALTLQVVLGILTLLHQVPIPLGLAHQAVAIVVLTLALFQAERLHGSRQSVGRANLGSAVGQTS
jgi:cytochrome c oxidase assembly protein subunit 15